MAHLVVLAEDDDDLGQLIKLKLEKADIRVIWKKNGNDALSAIRSQNPTAVLLDVDMPGINGLDLLKRIKLARDMQHIPVIMISALGYEAYSSDAMRHGASDLIVKSFQPADMLARVQKVLGAIPAPASP